MMKSNFKVIWGKPLCQKIERECTTLTLDSRVRGEISILNMCSYVLDATSNDTRDRVEVEGPTTAVHRCTQDMRLKKMFILTLPHFRNNFK